jgi:dienelactone hydrolase
MAGAGGWPLSGQGGMAGMIAGQGGMAGVAGVAGQAGIGGGGGMAGMAGVAGEVAGTGGMAGVAGMAGQAGMAGVAGVAGQAGMAGVGGVAGQAGVGGTGGQGGGGACCSTGDCICRGDDPATSPSTPGPYQTASYTFARTALYGGADVYYPTDAEPPYSGLVLCPGWTALRSSLAGWGPFLASYGIVVVIIDTLTTGDVVDMRDDQLLAALDELKAENTNSSSPLFGKLTDDRYGLGGWSMGGGGTWLATAAHPELKTGMTLAGHNATAGGGAIAAGCQVPTILFCGALDTAILGGGGQSQASYDAMPATTPKILYEISSADHFAWGTPTTTNGGALGSYGLAFQKTFLDGDERWRKFLLVEGPGASEWRSTIQ